MQKYAAILSYVGTDYCGWQRQKSSAANGAISIQETIEKALFQMTSESASVIGSGRTDSGVHALGQVAHFVLRNRKWDPGILLRGLNSILPKSIQCLDVREVPIEFHAQRSAIQKQYSYYFQQGPAAVPIYEPYSWWIKRRLDLKAMQTALEFLVGEHDFKAFQASGAKPGPTVRKIIEAQISFSAFGFPGGGLSPLAEGEIGLVRVRILGTGFLKQMVRGIAGTLLQIGEGRREPGSMKLILDSMDRSQVGPTAPGRALWLEKVWYY